MLRKLKLDSCQELNNFAEQKRKEVKIFRNFSAEDIKFLQGILKRRKSGQILKIFL